MSMSYTKSLCVVSSLNISKVTPSIFLRVTQSCRFCDVSKGWRFPDKIE